MQPAMLQATPAPLPTYSLQLLWFCTQRHESGMSTSLTITLRIAAHPSTRYAADVCPGHSWVEGAHQDHPRDIVSGLPGASFANAHSPAIHGEQKGTKGAYGSSPGSNHFENIV